MHQTLVNTFHKAHIAGDRNAARIADEYRSAIHEQLLSSRGDYILIIALINPFQIHRVSRDMRMCLFTNELSMLLSP